MIMCFVSVERRNFIKKQFSGSISNGQPGLANRRKRYGSGGRECNVVVADNRHIVGHSQSSGDKPLQKSNSQQVIRCKYRSRPLIAGHENYLFCRPDARFDIEMRRRYRQQLG